MSAGAESRVDVCYLSFFFQLNSQNFSKNVFNVFSSLSFICFFLHKKSLFILSHSDSHLCPAWNLIQCLNEIIGNWFDSAKYYCIIIWFDKKTSTFLSSRVFHSLDCYCYCLIYCRCFQFFVCLLTEIVLAQKKKFTLSTRSPTFHQLFLLIFGLSLLILFYATRIICIHWYNLLQLSFCYNLLMVKSAHAIHWPGHLVWICKELCFQIDVCI